MSLYPSQIAIIHNIPNRPTEAKPKMIRPIQNIIVFSPSNTANPQHTYAKPIFILLMQLEMIMSRSLNFRFISLLTSRAP